MIVCCFSGSKPVCQACGQNIDRKKVNRLSIKQCTVHVSDQSSHGLSLVLQQPPCVILTFACYSLGWMALLQTKYILWLSTVPTLVEVAVGQDK